ncbi:MAG TPA: electron transfer flavoprotein subunit beta/FixA family protein [Gemmatimonadaceae bacterium]|nr:electron transfer flavoprotein subunit beta/FixA family protein [Gemmatimonadaceae bacterium]
MKIAVCIKRAPDMEQRFKIAADGASVDATGLKFDISDFDAYAVEKALKITEAQGSGEVVVLSLGPDIVQETLRKALSLGATRAVQLKTDSVPFDSFAIAEALAAALRDGGYDLILFGKIALDSSNGAVGAMTAELLGTPYVTAVSQLDIADGTATARRELEGAAEIVAFPLPAVVSIDEGPWRPRLASLKGIMGAKRKPLEVKPAELAQPRYTVQTMQLPAERTGGRIIGEGADAVPELVRLLQTEAKVL